MTFADCPTLKSYNEWANLFSSVLERCARVLFFTFAPPAPHESNKNNTSYWKAFYLSGNFLAFKETRYIRKSDKQERVIDFAANIRQKSYFKSI